MLRLFPVPRLPSLPRRLFSMVVIAMTMAVVLSGFGHDPVAAQTGNAFFALGQEHPTPGDPVHTEANIFTFNHHPTQSENLLFSLEPAFFSPSGSPTALGHSVVNNTFSVPPLSFHQFRVGDNAGQGDYSVEMYPDTSNTSSVAWHRWDNVAEVALGQTEAADVVAIPVVVHDWNAQYSKVFVKNPATGVLDLQLEIYASGAASPTVSQMFNVGEFDSVLFDMRDFGLGAFLGSMILSSPSGRTFTAETVVHQIGNNRAVWGFEGVTSTYLGSELYAPLFRGGWAGDTGIAVTNVNANSVDVEVVYVGANDPRNGCNNRSITHGPVSVPANSSVVFYQGAGSHVVPITGANNLPPQCYGSAIIRSTGGDVLAIVNDAETNGTTVTAAGAYVTQPRSLAREDLFIPFAPDDWGSTWYTGIQMMNLDTVYANVEMKFFDDGGRQLTCPPTAQCSFRVDAGASYNFLLSWPPRGNVYFDNVASAMLDADENMIANVTIGVKPHGTADRSTYNALRIP